MSNLGELGMKYIEAQRELTVIEMICMRGMMGSLKGLVNHYASMNLIVVKELGLFCIMVLFIVVLDW